MIAIQALGKRFEDRWALREASLQVARGDFLGVLGRNGAGKTTLIRLLTGQMRPTEGTVRIQGLDPGTVPLALRSLVDAYDDEAVGAIKPLIPRLLAEFFKLMGEVENEARAPLSAATAPAAETEPQSRKDLWNVIFPAFV